MIAHFGTIKAFSARIFNETRCQLLVNANRPTHATLLDIYWTCSSSDTSTLTTGKCEQTAMWQHNLHINWPHLLRFHANQTRVWVEYRVDGNKQSARHFDRIVSLSCAQVYTIIITRDVFANWIKNRSNSIVWAQLCLHVASWMPSCAVFHMSGRHAASKKNMSLRKLRSHELIFII